MNLTVGPLPPAVYWRRRALVAGVLLLLVVLVSYSCGGTGQAGTGSKRTADTLTPTTPTPSPTVSELRPQTGGAPAADDGVSGGGSTAAPTVSPDASATGSATAGASADLCADADILLTPSVEHITGGTFPYELTIKIKNVSSRTCKRDIGSNPQELHIVSNGQTVWSSDSCQGGQGQNNVATFGPGIEDTFHVGWDGSSGPNCTNPAKMLPAGNYQIVAKLDSKVSAPVSFTIGGK